MLSAAVLPGQCVCRAVPVGGIMALQILKALDINGGPWAVAVLDEPFDIDDLSLLTHIPEISPRPADSPQHSPRDLDSG